MNDAPRFSVVVASFRDLDLVSQCLDSLRPQCHARGAELILARAEREPISTLYGVASGCRIVSAPADADVPRLRGLGLVQARGDWVAMTEDHCIADPNWLAALLGAAGPGVEVLGGRMGNARHARATDCGAFFSEYGFFGASHDRAAGGLPPLITGANVAYHQSVSTRVAAWASAGDWENVIHDRLHASGCRFGVVPAALIRQNQSYRLAAFCRDRFEHGRDYAATRARGSSAWRRASLAAATPILPLLLTARVARAVSPEERRHFWRALPATLTFFAAWSAGEALGYARAGGKA